MNLERYRLTAAVGHLAQHCISALYSPPVDLLHFLLAVLPIKPPAALSDAMTPISGSGEQIYLCIGARAWSSVPGSTQPWIKGTCPQSVTDTFSIDVIITYGTV